MNSSIQSELRLRGIASASELSKALDISQPTVSRNISALGAQHILRIGSARSTRYAAIRNIPNDGSSWPIYRITKTGDAEKAGVLTSLYNRYWHVESDAALGSLLREDFKEGIFPGFPWFLEDQRPQGFLGRIFARYYGPGLGLGTDPRLWAADDLLSALLSHGGDSQGNLILGDSGLEQHQRRRLAEIIGISPREKEEAYLRFAQAVLAGDPAGSSAAGEQPKFTAALLESPDRTRHVIVKFSPTAETPAGKRWGDLLTCEHLALSILKKNNIPASESTLLTVGGRIFLESNRFDRIGTHGRQSLFSIASFDAAYYGQADTPWTALAHRLSEHHWITKSSSLNLRLFWWYGTLIGNTDMHYGNVSLIQATEPVLQIAPCYDMLPMLYAPASNGEIVDRLFQPSPPPPDQKEAWMQASHWAIEFWNQVEANPTIQLELRLVAASNAKIIFKMQSVLG